ncbi:MAG TPA: WYL domain-containing protein [Caulobacteraceae bacterium]|jgi:hypothetical protein
MDRAIIAEASAEASRSWGVGQRLEFIEFRAFWEGAVNRSDLSNHFRISAPQVSNDLATYKELAPENLVYDGSAKRYARSETFVPKLTQPSSERFLAQLQAWGAGVLPLTDTWIGRPPVVEVMPLPARRVESPLLRDLMAAMRERCSVEILYQSMSPSRPDLQWRRISPHALATDGLRWHLRAFCHEDRLFKDFILSRCGGLRAPAPAAALPSDDADWQSWFEVVLTPNPELSPGQRAAVADEYAMTERKEAHLSARRAMLYYVKMRLRLDVEGDRPAERPVVVANRVEFDAALAAARGELVAASQA